VLSTALVLIASLAGAQATTPDGTPAEPLRALAPTHGIAIGAAVAYEPIQDEGRYRDVLRREFDVVTPENAMKWDTIHPARRRYDFTQADRIVALARRNRMLVRGHNLVWHVQNPPWLDEALASASRHRAIAILRAHIDHVARHFRHDVAQWDVVNEPLSPTDGTLRDSPWLRAIGPDYIPLAFVFAHRAAPHARLYLNEFGLEVAGPKLDGMVALVASLQAARVPIDGVGFQSHVICLFGCEQALPELGTGLARVAALGVDVAITELDVALVEPATAQDLAEQAATYGTAVDACLAVPRCRTIVSWGFTDRHSWIADLLPGIGAALPFDADYRPKPAYWAIHDRLQ
jgi:endo-1,4-beta-xylanase